jgi:hypothetical protein
MNATTVRPGTADELIRFAGLVGDLWQHALSTDYHRGRAEGERVGYLRGKREEHDGWVAALGHASDVMRSPRFAELDAIRAESITTPCSTLSCAGRCSRCIRAAAVARNRARYGQPDYPGADALVGVR